MHQSFVLENVRDASAAALNQSDVVKFSALQEEYPLYFRASITAVYLAILIVGLVGNAITCVVIITNRSMHTVPNCYLFNLAVSDLLLLLSGLPFDIVTSWDPYKYDFGVVGCFLRGWLSETSADVSILTITAFTFERYLAVCRPITAQVMSKLSRAIRLIIVIWIVSLLCGAVIAYQSEDLVFDNEYKCGFNASIPYSLDIMGLLFFVIPLVVITILYILIGRSLQRSENMKGRLNNCPDRYSKNTVNMLVVIVVVFFICWAPFQAQRMLFAHAPDVVSDDYVEVVMTIVDGLYYVSGIFYFFSGAVNPIIYNIMSNKFRDAFKETISKSWCFKKKESVSFP